MRWNIFKYVNRQRGKGAQKKDRGPPVWETWGDGWMGLSMLLPAKYQQQPYSVCRKTLHFEVRKPENGAKSTQAENYEKWIKIDRIKNKKRPNTLGF